MTEKLTHILALPEDKRQQIHAKVLEGLAESFPIKSRSKVLDLEDLDYQKKDFTPTEQKQAILRGDTLYETIKGTVIMRDAEGTEIDRVKNFTLARVPWFTDRHTVIVGGNEYTVSNQVRPKPGVYTRKRANGMLEAQFNTDAGSNFNIVMDPEKGEPQLEYASSKIPLYPILRAGGVSHQEISKAWGNKLADQNEKSLAPKQNRAVAALYKRIVPSYSRSENLGSDGMAQEVFRRYDTYGLDPEVTERTLGKKYKTVTPHTMLDASRKVLDIFRSNADPDDRDNLDFKALYGVDDFFKQRIKLDSREVARKAAIKMEAVPELRRALPAGPFTGGILKFINSSQLVTVPTQTNPMDVLDSAMRVTAMGEGGISTDRAIPLEARQPHVTQMGALDPFRTPESFRAGVDVRAAIGAMKDANNNIYVPLIDLKTHKMTHVRAGRLQEDTVAFSGETLKGDIDALHKGVVRRVPASLAKYQFPHASYMYGPTTNLVPFIESMQGNRSLMGSKMQTQALSLVDRDEPYVQIMGHDGKSFEEKMSWLTNARSPVKGTVEKIDGDHIYVRADKPRGVKESAKEELHAIPYMTNFPFAAKTHMTQTPTVKVGDRVSAEGQITESNFTRNGRLALGKNLSVAYVPYHGANSNDAVVISEGAAKKLTSERMYKIIVPRDADLSLEKNKHQAYYGQNYTKDQYSTLGVDGLIKPGTIVRTGDPLIAGLRKATLTSDDVLLGKLHRSLVKPYREQVQSWDHDHEGEVIDVVKTPKRIAITVKTREPMTIGDKLCYTGDTDVLTTEGWVPVSQVTKDHVCYTLNSSGGIELHAPTDLHAYESAGSLYTLDTQQVKLRVTPNHALYIKKRGHLDFELVQAQDVIGKRVQHKKAGNWTGESVVAFTLPEVTETSKGRNTQRIGSIPAEHWYRFLGMYIANGSTWVGERKGREGSPEYRVSIHSIKGVTHSVSGDQYAWVEKTLRACGFTYTARDDRFIINSRQLAEYLKPFGHAKDKYLPADAFAINRDLAQALLDGLLGCDGHLTKSNSLGYTTVSRRLADDVQRLALHVGAAANIGIKRTRVAAWNTCYTVNLVYAKLEPRVNHGHRSTQSGQSESIAPSDEPVWGITVPNHVLYVRVAGVPVWSGNSGRYGNKGVVSEIVPDDEMLKDEEGRTIDLLISPSSVVSRTNPAQIIETAVGKVAEKTGKPIIVENLSGRNNVEWAKGLLKEHGIKDKETLFDPRTGKHMPNVFVGRQYTLKLMKSTETNYAGRGTVGGYDVNLQPTKGGTDGAKILGKMEFDALVAHNARNVLREAATLKSQKNDEYWKAVQLGYPTPPLQKSFAYDKLNTMLAGAGVHVQRDKGYLNIGPMTDKRTMELSSGEIREPTLIKAKNFAPETGGLFDPAVTGGLSGTKWGHISLVEPVVSPTFKEPVRRLLGLSGTDLDTLIAEKGGGYIRKELAKIDMNKLEKELRERSKTKSADSLDDEVKQLKYIQALRAAGMTPDEAYTITKVPVVPPIIRPVIPGRGNQEIMYGDANPLYRDLIYTNNQFKEIRKSGLLPADEKKLRPALHQAVGAVYGTDDPISSKSKARGHRGFLTYISGTTTPKEGFFHSKVMRRAQDMAGRGTIVPDTTLGMDEIGLPEDMIWEMYTNFIIKGLVGNGYNALDATKMVKDRHPAAKALMEREARERPVMFNRAPTLHRYSILGAYPKPVPGKTIRINPFVEAPMNADFDGDCTDSHLEFTIEGRYTRLHISECPHNTENAVVKGNKEVYEVPTGVKVFGYSDKEQRVVLCDVTHFSVHHDLDMVDVETVTGRKVKVSRDHSMFGMNPETGVLERFKATDGIGWGIVRPRKLFNAETLHGVELKNKELCSSMPLTETLGWLIGAWAGDGWIARSPRSEYDPTTLGLANKSPEVKAHFKDVVSAIEPGISIREYSSSHKFKGHDCYSEKTHANSRPFARLFSEITQNCTGAANKQLPSYFVQGSREFLLGLFAGLLDTDGTVAISNAKAKNKPQFMVAYSTMSEALADHIATLALMLGVRSNYCWYQKKNEGNWYCQVSFSTPDIAKIAADIPCVHARKRDLLDRLSKEDFDPAAGHNARHDMLPVPIGWAAGVIPHIGSGNVRVGSSPEQHAEALKTKTLYITLRKVASSGRISREILYRIIDVLGEDVVRMYAPDGWLELARNENILWDFIKTVTPIEGKQTAWDLTIPDGATFMTSNHLVVYDTMMIHAPVSARAVEEVKGMTMSKVLYGDATKNELYAAPKFESLMGISLASQTDDRNKPMIFKNHTEADAAYCAGKITLGTRVVIKE